MNRREFFRIGAAGSLIALAGPTAAAARRPQDVRGGTVALISDPASRVAASPPAQWALGELEKSLHAAGMAVRRLARLEDAGAGDVCVLASDPASKHLGPILHGWGLEAGWEPESMLLHSTESSGRQALVAAGADTRGLVYALLDLSDRVRPGMNAAAAFHYGGHLTAPRAFGLNAAESPASRAATGLQPRIERRANPVRSVMRQFTSEPLDKPWFYDRDFWRDYLTMLATHRFNRFQLAFGFGYDSLVGVEESYFLFVYPFLLDVPGYDVRMSNLSDEERDRNLDTLRFISEETVARGMEFQMGVWTHGYVLPNSPRAQHHVEGLTDETHAAYCRDALTAVLRACPAISAVALRIHGESGVAEGSYDFWNTVFRGVPNAGRTIEMDLHAKGIDQRMIDQALATGMPVNVSPKLHAEHMGMPYHQAAIREWEMPEEGQVGSGLMTISEGQRSFTRYGYADLMRDDRKYTVRHRVFSGTQRILAWGDPASAAAYSRSYSFCGSTGMDLMEPLTCRGRRGTASGSRVGYRDRSLDPRWDFEKYAAWYRTMGRTAYDPETQPEVFSRAFAGELGADVGAEAAAALESSLAVASRILPIVTTVYCPSAACDAYWPEIYWNQPIMTEARPNPYFDTPRPITFHNAGPIDPQIFSRMSEFAGELLSGGRSGKYSPLDAALWLDDHASRAMVALEGAEESAELTFEAWASPGTHSSAAGRPSAEWRRLAVDIRVMAALGRFFAAKFRAGVLYALFEQSGDRRALEPAVSAYRGAVDAWRELADLGGRFYQDDLSASDRFSERGQWTDRLAAIEEDAGRMTARLSETEAAEDARVPDALSAIASWPLRNRPPIEHTPPAELHPGFPLALSLVAGSGERPVAVKLYYRHVNQAERFVSVETEQNRRSFRAEIPAAYTDSPFPLQYYFEIRTGAGDAWTYPGFDPDLANQPYFGVERG